MTTMAATAPARVLIPVTGQPWSSPAYPVLCKETSGQVSCTPTNGSDVKPQQCFRGVLMDGIRATVCTTYEGHVRAIQEAGGKALIVEYGCSVGDVVCVTFENAGRGMAMGTTAVMLLVAANMRFDTTTVLWTAAVGEWSFWQWAVLAVLFGAMVWAIAAAIVSGNRDELVGAIVRTFIAIPAVPLTLWGIGHLLNAIDDLTWYVMNRDGPITLFQDLQKVMWAGGQANYFFAFLIHGLLLLAMLLLMLVFAFRNIALAALIAVGPVAWMLFPVKTVGPQWVVRYVSATVALLLAGPLTNGFVALIVNGLADVESIWDPQSWPLLVGLVLAAFAPLAVFGLFSFVGGSATDSLGSRIGSSAGRVATSAARSAGRMPSRLAGMPAGIPAAGAARGAVSATAAKPSRSSTQRPAGAGSPARSRTAPTAKPAANSAPTASRPTPPATPAPPHPERKMP
ncbi:hypothetical protein [Microbacterium sp. YJN-G]|uniref:hypothetical protein n=1 Tax=Microbacterium sp. YJN-G TaxID=2763257 RepID=UPI0018778E6D|nr:hypothetical protein [Microbacterium sp. YJN-G]